MVSMSQLTIYLDRETEKKIKAAARRAKSTVSSWVKNTLNEALETTWPKDFFTLYGSLSSAGIKRPRELRFEDDAPRKKL